MPSKRQEWLMHAAPSHVVLPVNCAREGHVCVELVPHATVKRQGHIVMPAITFVNVQQPRRHVVLEKLVIRGITPVNVDHPVLAQETHKEHIAIQAITPANVPRRLHYVRHLRHVMEVLANVVLPVHVQEMPKERIAIQLIMFVNVHLR